MNTSKIYWADKLGAASVLLCIIHCLAAPVLLAMGIGFLNNIIVALLFIFIALISIYNATKGRILEPVSVFLWAAFVAFVVCVLFEEKSEFFQYGMYLSSTGIIFGHFYNMKSCLKP